MFTNDTRHDTRGLMSSDGNKLSAKILYFFVVVECGEQENVNIYSLHFIPVHFRLSVLDFWKFFLRFIVCLSLLFLFCHCITRSSLCFVSVLKCQILLWGNMPLFFKHVTSDAIFEF